MFRRLGLLCFVLLTACSSDSTPVTEPTGPGSLIAWSIDGIRVLDALADDDTEAVDLETGAGAVSQVTPSLDGRIAWTGIEGTTATTRIGSLEGGPPEEVAVPTAPFYYAWDPTGERLAFLGNDPDGAGVLFGSIDVASGTVSRHHVATPFFFDWSGDGSQVLANIGGTALGRFDFPEGDLTDVGIAPGPFPTPLWGSERAVIVGRRGPTVRPRLVLVSSHAEGEIVSLDPSTGERRVIAETRDAARVFGDPTGLRLAVVEGVAGDQTLTILDRDTGDVIADRSADLFAVVQWSPDGSRLLYTTGGSMLTPRLWSPDSEEDARFDPFRPSDVFRAAYLPFWDQYDRSLSLWALDSSRFALPTQGGVLVVATTGEARLVEGASMGVFAPEPTP